MKTKERNEFSYLPIRQPDTGIFTVLKNKGKAYFSLLLESGNKTEVFYMMNTDIGDDGYCYPTRWVLLLHSLAIAIRHTKYAYLTCWVLLPNKPDRLDAQPVERKNGIKMPIPHLRLPIFPFQKEMLVTRTRKKETI